MFFVLTFLAVAAAIGTFIENDYGNDFAKSFVYTSLWFQFALFIAALNMLLVIFKAKIKLLRPGPIFHFAFIIILMGAFITHYFGIDGVMHIREGEKSNIIRVDNHIVTTPFFIELKNFELKRYPGSRSPSEYSSDVKVIDNKANKEFDASIYMNHTLTYKSYKFFQTSYDPDEKGTVLSVNKDPGLALTYIGYTLLFLGLLLVVFDKNSRIRFLIRQIKSMNIASFLLPLAILFSIESLAQQNNTNHYAETYIQEYKELSKDAAATFGKLIVQGPMGRMKPMDSQNREILSKLSGKSTWHGMSANQVILGMLTRPEIWKKLDIIKVRTPKLRKLLGVPKSQKLLAFNDFFDDNGHYKLTDEIDNANKIEPGKRGTFERDLIQVDELLNIAFMSFRGMLIKVFPLPNDSSQKWVNMPDMFLKMDNVELQNNTGKMLDLIYNRDYDKSIFYINKIADYQKKIGNNIIPYPQKQYAELWYNKSSLFMWLFIAYLLFGFLLLAYSFISIFNNNIVNIKIRKTINIIVSLLFILHSFGIALRWYIGGFAPISNTYETMIYIAYTSILVAILFFRKSALAMSASLIMAGVFIFSAFLGEINPQITNLVPVLKSYWLSIHVSVITASYGFMGVGALIGFISLIIFAFKSDSRRHLDLHIQKLTYLNEITLIFGIILLTIGNFLGAIWANESWGRYWGWDPKETWTFISIIVYTLLLHIRLIKKWYSHYLFAIGSIVSYYSILMTYYGVNYYLSGMHSYAAGDPIPLPKWLYYSVVILFLAILFSFRKRKI